MIAIGKLAVAIAALTGMSIAHADLVERTSYLDIRTLGLPSEEFSTTLLFDEFTVGEGDRLVFTINFIGGDIRVIDTGGDSWTKLFFLFAEGSDQTGFGFDLTTTLLGVKGDLLQNDLTAGFGGPIGGFYQTNLTDTTFRYSGLVLDFNIGFKEPGRPDLTASDMRFDQRFFIPGVREGGGLLVRVPEPATLALLGIGVLGIGATRRRKRLA